MNTPFLVSDDTTSSTPEKETHAQIPRGNATPETLEETEEEESTKENMGADAKPEEAPVYAAVRAFFQDIKSEEGVLQWVWDPQRAMFSEEALNVIALLLKKSAEEVKREVAALNQQCEEYMVAAEGFGQEVFRFIKKGDVPMLDRLQHYVPASKDYAEQWKVFVKLCPMLFMRFIVEGRPEMVRWLHHIGGIHIVTMCGGYGLAAGDVSMLEKCEAHAATNPEARTPWVIVLNAALQLVPHFLQVDGIAIFEWMNRRGVLARYPNLEKLVETLKNPEVYAKFARLCIGNNLKQKNSELVQKYGHMLRGAKEAAVVDEQGDENTHQ